MQKVVLNNGLEMPILGFGVFQMTDLTECERCVVEAIQTGYQLIDTAASYGNEEAVGRAIKRSGMPREGLFHHQAVARGRRVRQDEARVRPLAATARAGLPGPVPDPPAVRRRVRRVAGDGRAVPAGRDKVIGVSNFHPDRVMDLILHNEVPPAVNQVETHPFQQQVETQQFLTENKVQIESWGPFAEGKNDIFHNHVLRSVGAKYGKRVAQVILRWLTQRGVVAIPKSVRKERMAENFNVFDFRLSDEDIAVIATLDTGTSAFFDHRDPEVVRRLATAKRNT